jgi:hypothetical protein
MTLSTIARKMATPDELKMQDTWVITPYLQGNQLIIDPYLLRMPSLTSTFKCNQTADSL